MSVFCICHLLQQLQHCPFSPLVHSSSSAWPPSLATFCLYSTLQFTNSHSVLLAYKRFREVRCLTHNHTAKSPAGTTRIWCNWATPCHLSTHCFIPGVFTECLLGARLCPMPFLQPSKPRSTQSLAEANNAQKMISAWAWNPR